MGRPPGSKNKPKQEKAVINPEPVEVKEKIKRASKKTTKKVVGKKPIVLHTSQEEWQEQKVQEIIEQQTNQDVTMADVLSAIGQLTNFVGNLAQDVEAMKSGDVVQSQPQPQSEVQSHYVTRTKKTKASANTMLLDSTPDAPLSEEKLEMMEIEGDVQMKTTGWDVFQKGSGPKDAVSLGRSENDVIKNAKCENCGKDMSPSAGYRGVFRHEGCVAFTQTGTVSRILCNACIIR